MSIKLVKKFMHKGLYCEIRRIDHTSNRDFLLDLLWSSENFPSSHLCGYVFLDKEHPLYGVDYDYMSCDIGTCINGGLTYSNYEGEQWVLGFDYNHGWNENGGTVEDVEKDCKSLCEQLEKVESFEVDFTDDYYCDKLPDAVVIKDTIYKHDDDVPDFVDELKELCEKYNVDIQFNDISQYTYRSYHTEMNVSFISKAGVIDVKKIWGR